MNCFLFILVNLLSLTIGKTILLSNDDGFTSTEIRALYRDLKEADYDVIMVAPVRQRSGYGGALVVPESNVLEEDGEFGYIKSGEPAWGQDPEDDDIWYFDGTPAACISFAFEYLLPKEYPNTTIDLVAAGPNQGPNLTPGFYTTSGTMGATYSGLYRGYQSISFSGSNLNNSFFKDSLDDDEYNPSNIYAKKAVDLIDLVLEKDNFLPPLTGLNVNFPEAGYLLDDKTQCVDPVWKLGSMLHGGVFIPIAKYDEDSDSFSSYYKYYSDIQKKCTKGTVCDLPGEYEIFWARNCTTAISIFSGDYSANQTINDAVSNKLKSLF